MSDQLVTGTLLSLQCELGIILFLYMLEIKFTLEQAMKAQRGE
jgi:hypothetical protein